MENPQQDGLSPHGPLELLTKVGSSPGRAASWLLFPTIVVVLVAVVASVLRFGILLEWDWHVPILGDQLTVTGLAEMQWHFFALMVMLGGAYALSENAHVRVDFIYGRLSARAKRLVDLIGHLIFLLPFCGLMIWLSIGFIQFSYVSGEGSDYGGLTDRWIIKSVLPVGFGLLAIVGMAEIFSNLRFLLSQDVGKR